MSPRDWSGKTGRKNQGRGAISPRSVRQIAIVNTEWAATPAEIAGPQFGRWYQENYFKYAREHFDLDRLINYQLSPIDETTKGINPVWRKLDGEIRKRTAKRSRKKAKLCEQLNATETNDPGTELMMIYKLVSD